MTEKERESHQFRGVVRKLQHSDLEGLKPILETWIRGDGAVLSEEVDEDLRNMEASIDQENGPQFLIAENKGAVVGVIGLRDPDPRMLEFANSGNPAELINAYVAKGSRDGKGVGTALVASLEEMASSAGYTEIVLNSGPRYKDTGWGFYDKLAGYNRAGFAKDYYGLGADAPVWRKVL